MAAPIPLINIDTDMLIPKQFLKTIKRTGLGIHLFSEMRYHESGKEIDAFVLNKPAYRTAEILIAEQIEPDIEILDTYVKASYPDLRKCINMLQQNCRNGKLMPPASGDSGQQDYRLQMVELFKQGKINEARKLVCAQARPEECEEIYRWLYDNLEIISKDEDAQDKAVLIIKQGLVDHSFVADPEINLASVMIKLARLQK